MGSGRGPGVVRDRSCFYYVPWIALFSLGLLAGSLGVWIHFVVEMKNKTVDALDALSVTAHHIDRPTAAMIATSVVFLVTVVFVVGLSLARSFIEAAHDATGLSGGGSTVWMVLNVIFAIPWWLLTLWMVVLVMGCTIWEGLVYVLRESIQSLFDRFGVAGPDPPPTWIPSDNTPCPGQCLDLTSFGFIDESLASSCICDYAKLQASHKLLKDGYRFGVAVIIGIWGMFISALLLLVNFACQFSHTKREKEYIKRLTYKQFIGV